MAIMSVVELECQLAQAQLQRYLAGAGLEPDVKKGLEAHLTECEACRIEAKVLREKLRQRVAQAEPSATAAVNMAAVHMPAPASKSAQLLKTLNLLSPASGPQKAAAPTKKAPAKQAPAHTPSAATPQGATKNWKPLLWSGALATLLVLMSMIQDPSRLFGARAIETKPAMAPVAVPTASENAESNAVGLTPEQAQQVLDNYPTALLDWSLMNFFRIERQALQPVVEPTPATPAPTTAASAVAPTPAQPARRVAPPRTSSTSTRTRANRVRNREQGVGTIRVYDPVTGKPVNR